MSESFSSIGHLGNPEHRSDQRFYLNAGVEMLQDPAVMVQTWESLLQGGQTASQEVSRVVLRGIVSDAVLDAVRNSAHSEMLEAVIPLEEALGRPNNNLIYMGHNAPERQSPLSIETIAEATRNPRPIRLTPEQRVQDALQAGAVIKTRISAEDYDGLHRLWGPTFGWERNEERDQIAELAERLDTDQLRAPQDRTVWFAGLERDGELVGAAMAERLTLPGTDGPIDLVESTEWSVHDDHGGGGNGATVLAALHAQILHDLRDSPNGLPLIFAECNFSSRADQLGNSAGMVIPSREHAGQVLRQNVAVGDGQEPEGLRDFNLMFLPPAAVQAYYSPAQTDRIMGVVHSEGRT